MIVTCEQCQARFKLADEKVKPEGTKVRCSKCQSIFTVLPPTPPAPAATADTIPPPTAAEPSPEEATASGQATAEPEQPAAEPPPEAATAQSAAEGMEFDFSAQGETTPGDEEAGRFSFDSPDLEEDAAAGEFNFEEGFTTAETTSPADRQTAEGPSEFDFGDTLATDEPPADSPALATGEFDFSEDTQGEPPTEDFPFDEEETSAAGAGEFDFSTETGAASAEEAAEPSEFDFSAENSGFGEISFDEGERSDFSLGDQPGDKSADFGMEDKAWEAPESGGHEAFDFEEPKFDGQPEETETSPASLSFGEIDFSDDEDEGALPSFDTPPDFSRPAEQPAENVVPPPGIPAPPVPPAPPRQAVSRPRSEELIPPPPLPRRSPASRMVVMLGVLLLMLCGAGGYLYMSGDGERLISQAIMKIKGEKPAVPVEQLIGFSNIVTSYVNNSEAGQLLVVQGMVTNNFQSPRSAIAIKGLLLDGAGKVVQQQTVFCGNYLSEQKLRTLKYAAIEEAMGNQFGDSLSNMNVKPGASLKFTIVFRNVPAEIANINFEPVDSKPGSS